MHHHLHSVNNSGSMSGINSAKNSNRPSKTSDVQRTNSVSDNIFEKASLILQQQYSSELPPRPHVTFCNPKE